MPRLAACAPSIAGDSRGLRPLLSSLLETLLACSIWKDAQVQQELYRYYKPETRGLDQEGLLEDLSKGSPGDVVLLHACAHNPTGVLSSPSPSR